jgi:large subunit ribosomal protein L23Ae
MKAKSPLYPRTAKLAVKVDPKAQPTDFYTTILYPLSTEKAMKKMEDENTMVFIVNARCNKI